MNIPVPPETLRTLMELAALTDDRTREEQAALDEVARLLGTPERTGERLFE